tara:strand:- start:89 stop:1105 length:1017 start_codon:yes stop_codon:yes gene_type:complete
MLVRHHRGLSVGSDPAWGQGSRGIVAGGGTPWTSKIEYVTIATTGNAADFGVVHGAGPNSWDGSSNLSGTAGDGRGFILAGHDGGYNGTNWSLNLIRYLTIATTSDSADFGDLTRNTGRGAATSNGKRALYFGGNNPSFSNSIDYFAIATLGNASVYGTITSGELGVTDATGDGTYGMVGKGYDSSWGQNTWVDYCNIDTTGNTTFFGGAFVSWGNNVSIMGSGMFACSNGVRAFYGGGYQQENPFGGNNWEPFIEYWTFAVPTSNSLEWGELPDSTDIAPGCSDGARGMVMGRGDYKPSTIYYFDMNASGSGNTGATFGTIYHPQNGRGGAAALAGD